MKHLIAKYNQPSTVLFISSYPERNVLYSKKVCAVGGITKNTIMRMDKNRLYVVLTVKIGNSDEIYEEDNVLVCRVIDRENPFSFFTFAKTLLKFSYIKNVITEFEFGSFGPIYNTLFFSLMFPLIALRRMQQHTVIHQVVSSLNALNGHLGWSKKSPKTALFNWGINFYYRFITLFSKKVVTTEMLFQKRLESLTHKKGKIVTIPLGVESDMKEYTKTQSKKMLSLPRNKKIVLFFGYLGWYKGADLFVKYARKCADPSYHFVIAGGSSLTNGNKEHYKKYVRLFSDLPKNTTMSGFVQEEDIAKYFSASDIVVLPYRVMMSSSGPLTYAFAKEKPVIFSDALKEYTRSKDFSEAMKKAGITDKELFFKLDVDSFMQALINAPLDKLSAFSSEMKRKRDYKNIASLFEQMLK